MNINAPIADLKSHLSEYLGRVLYRHEVIVITRRGKPIAKLSPIDDKEAVTDYGNGLLEDGDSFFGIMDQIVADRATHLPRSGDKPSA